MVGYFGKAALRELAHDRRPKQHSKAGWSEELESVM